MNVYNDGFPAYRRPQLCDAKNLIISVVALVALLAITSVVTGGAFHAVGLYNHVINYSLMGTGGGVLFIAAALAGVKSCMVSHCLAVHTNTGHGSGISLSDSDSDYSISDAKDADISVNSPDIIIRNGAIDDDSLLKLQPLIDELKEWSTSAGGSLGTADNLENISSRLTHEVQNLNRKKRMLIKGTINEILVLHHGIEKQVGNIDHLGNFTQLKTSVLVYFFCDTLTIQGSKVQQIQERLTFHHTRGCINDEEAQFIQGEIDFWKSQLNLGIPIALPKYYHCTPNIKNIPLIALSSIFYKHDGAFPGAFAANLPQTRYGSFGFALSKLIETTGVVNPNEKVKKIRLPIKSKTDGEAKVEYCNDEELRDQQLPEFEDKQFDVEWWLGFQNPAGIPMKRPDIEKNPLAFYADTTIAYVYYLESRTEEKDRRAIKEHAKNFGLRVISVENLRILRKAINLSFPLNFPTKWKGNILGAESNFEDHLDDPDYCKVYDPKESHEKILDADFVCLYFQDVGPTF